MNINDLLYNNNETIDERSIVYFDGCNWIHQPLDTDIFTCKDVRDCIDSDFIMSLLNIGDGLSILTSEIGIDISWVNSEITVSFDGEVLVVGNTEINVTDFLDDLSITFNDGKNGFNTLGITEIYIEAMDGLVFTNDGVNTLSIGLPTPPAEYFLDHNNDGPSPQLPGDYLPFNNNLVLTWNEEQHRAERQQAQCCHQDIQFTNLHISINLGDDFIDTKGINTDNQELTLTGNELSLSRRHGGTDGVQIPDTDSIVDLTNINEHTLGLNGNRVLGIYGSDGLLNEITDLINVGPKTIDFDNTTNTVNLLNDNGDIQSSVDISGVNNQLLSIVNGWLHLSGDDGCCGKNVVYFRKPTQYCSDVMGCVCGTDITRSEREAFGVTDPSTRPVPTRYADRNAVDPVARPLPLTWPDGREDFLDTNPSICDMLNFLQMVMGMPRPGYGVNGTDGDDGADGGIGPAGSNGVPGPQGPAGSDGAPGPAGPAGPQGIPGQAGLNAELIAKQKYRGRIYTSETRVMRSQNRGTGIDGGEYARRYIPQMDKGDGRANSSTQMLNPTNFIPEDNDTLYIGGDSYGLSPSLGYTTAKSANNPNNADEGKLCRAESKTLTIPFDGMYQISANLEFEVDHNVHAFRASILWRSVDDNLIRPLVDTKWGGDTSVGSRSLNNPAYPTTKQYTSSGMKLVELKKGDVLFLGIRIDPETSWPKDIPSVWLNEQSNGGPGSGIDDPYGWISFNKGTTGSPLYGRSSSPTLPSISISYPYFGAAGYTTLESMYEGQAGSYLRIPWNAPMAPDLTQRFFWSPVGGISGSEAYGYALAYPDMDNGYWNDDGVVKLLGPSNIVYPSGSGGESCPEGGSMITAVYVNKKYAVSP